MATKKRIPPDWREVRRFCALALKRNGWKQVEIAAALGVTTGAVCQWVKKVRDHGPRGLRAVTHHGPRPRVDEAQRVTLANLLDQGAEAHGFRGQVWTRARVAAVITQHFGVVYDENHVGRILTAMGFSRQVPQQRATQRQDDVIQSWVRERWPELKKSSARGPHNSLCR